MGDTCHPSSGYITERNIGEIHTVSDLLNFDYEFPCLVEFGARIGSTFVEKIADSEDRGKYQIVASSKEIHRLESTINEKCEENHTLYQYQIDW